jgi:hypothetical protein
VWPIASMMSLRKSMGRYDGLKLRIAKTNVDEQGRGRNGAA